MSGSDKRRTMLALCVPVVCGVWLYSPIAASTQAAASRFTGAGHSRIVTVALPVTERGFVTAVRRLSVITRTAVGIETVAADARPTDSVQPEYEYDLTGLSVPIALNEALRLEHVTQFPKYEWSSDAGVVHVAPSRFRNNRLVALNRRVSSYTMNVTSVVDALQSVHQLFNPGYKIASRGRPKHVPDSVKPLFNRHLTFSVSNVTVRQILDEVARTHGGMLWIVEYSRPEGVYDGMRISFVGFDNWAASADAGPKR